MPRCWREVLFLFMRHEYKIREGGRNFPQKGMVPWHAEENSRAGTACKWGGKRRIKEIEITVLKYFLKKQDDCIPLNPKTQGENYRGKHLFSLCFLYCSLRQAKSFSTPLSSAPFSPRCPQLLTHIWPLSSFLASGGHMRKVVLSPGVNLFQSPLCCAAVLGWNLFRCRDDRRKRNEAAEYVWRVAESSYHHVFV